jgi:hypothetical protein
MNRGMMVTNPGRRTVLQMRVHSAGDEVSV